MSADAKWEKNELENSDTVESITVQASKYFQCSNFFFPVDFSFCCCSGQFFE